jgi:hypothetical protein
MFETDGIAMSRPIESSGGESLQRGPRKGALSEAVRQTPDTPTLSPVVNRPKPEGGATVRRAPPRRCSSETTLPNPATIPVNTMSSLRSDSAGHQDVFAEPFYLYVIEAGRRGEGEAIAADAAGSAVASQDARREEDCDPVHALGPEEFPEGGRSAFHQETRDAFAGELPEQNRDAHVPGSAAGQAPDGDSPGNEPADRRALRRTRGHEDHAFGLAEETRALRDPEAPSR